MSPTKQRKREQPAEPDDEPDERPEFNRFQELTHKLLRVPKSEVDEKRQDE